MNNSKIIIVVLVLLNALLLYKYNQFATKPKNVPTSEINVDKGFLNRLHSIIEKKENDEIRVALFIPSKPCITCLVSHKLYDQLLSSSVGERYEVIHIGKELRNEPNSLIKASTFLDFNSIGLEYDTNRLLTVVYNRNRIIDYHLSDPTNPNKTAYFFDRVLGYLNVD